MRRFNYAPFCLAVLFAMAVTLPGCAPLGGSSASTPSTPSGRDASASSGSKKSGSFISKLMAPARKPITIPAGTDLHVILDGTLSSGENHSGDAFDATISEPIIIGGKTVVARDARAKGTVVEARSSGRLSKPAFLSVALTSVQAGHAWVDVQTGSVTLEGKSHAKRDVVAIGGGSALGAIIGGIAGGGKGAAIGAAAGAGAGTAGAAVTGKKEVSFPSESHLTFRLRDPITVKLK